MADDSSTNVLIVLLAILAVVVILFLVTVVAIILRWRKSQEKSDVTLRYLKGSRLQPTTWTHYGQSNNLDSPYSEVIPNSFNRVSYPETDESNDSNKDQTDDGIKSVEAPVRVSTISGKSIDIGHVSGVSEFTLKPAVIPARGTMTYGEYKKRKMDSMRSSIGVDLGADYDKAHGIIGNSDDGAFYF